ncbi:hypothetical protein ACIRQP_35435 [Streptomyces sp. NPDC102274]|uniref:hypothetical protein n=1 Tax=Streptomyces sp. NPDC102274 TaxID=3366151 RepID=UPI003814894A
MTNPLAPTRTPGFGALAVLSQVAYDDVLRVWREANSIPQIEHARLFDHRWRTSANAYTAGSAPKCRRRLAHRSGEAPGERGRRQAGQFAEPLHLLPRAQYVHEQQVDERRPGS